MKNCLLMVLAVVLLSVTEARAAGNAEDLQNKFSSQFSMFYDLSKERRGMMPFKMLDAGDKVTTLDQFKGRFIVLHFWATWCPPCIKELPKLKAFKTAKEGKDLAVVMVSLDYGAPYEKIDQFMKKHGVDGLPSYRVPTTDPAWDQLTAFGLPGTFLIDKKGRVLYKVIGDTDWTSPESTDFINFLIANQTK